MPSGTMTRGGWTMIGLLHCLASFSPPPPAQWLAPLGQSPGLLPLKSLMDPMVVMTLCVVAGLGTLMLLPSRNEGVIRKLGGTVVLAVALIFGAKLIHQGGAHFYFWIFAFIAVAGAMRVITHPRPVYSALYFVLTVLATAGLYVLLWAEFMAAALILIYAGAILITYVFVIMLASQTSGQTKPLKAVTECDAVSREPLVASAVGFALMGVLLFVVYDKAYPIAPASQAGATPCSTVPLEGSEAQGGSTQALGWFLFNNHLVNLELAGLILTVSMVGAIVIARRRVVGSADAFEPSTETFTAPATPIDDNPHSIPVYGTENPRQKEYPET
jgi:NADH-quinone oxidoreductase subunit J